MLSSARKESFESVVRAYANDVFRFLYWLSRDRGVAEDLAQETFARAWAAWEDQRDEKAVKAWLFAIARREHARTHERKSLDIDPDVDLDELVARHATDPGLAIDLRRAFAALPVAYREALFLHVVAGLSGAEIAAAAGIGEDAVHARLSRGRKALRALLDAGPRAMPATKERKP